MPGILGFVGGLLLSALKRQRGIKAWGPPIPGHGAMLDLDSPCLSAPAFHFRLRCGWSPRADGAALAPPTAPEQPAEQQGSDAGAGAHIPDRPLRLGQKRVGEHVRRQVQRNHLPLALDLGRGRGPVGIERERSAGNREELVCHRPVGHRHLAVAEEACRVAELGRRQVAVENPLVALDHSLIVRAHLIVAA
ncbi:MAG TPA: hypothetical protein DCY47_19260 [Candidatus Accumulibacter sp.]|nr:hypothetical protein [Accumulibacter sp.]